MHPASSPALKQITEIIYQIEQSQDKFLCQSSPSASFWCLQHRHGNNCNSTRLLHGKVCKSCTGLNTNLTLKAACIYLRITGDPWSAYVKKSGYPPWHLFFTSAYSWSIKLWHGAIKSWRQVWQCCITRAWTSSIYTMHCLAAWQELFLWLITQLQVRTSGYK